MISVSDIMIGDYLQNTNGNIGRVIGIRPYMGTAPSMKYNYVVIMQYHQTGTAFSDPKLLMPVAISPEMLEKNGWFFKGRIWVKKGPMRLCWYPHNAGLIVDYHQLPFAVEYVHHLQHVQRMYGLEEIVL